MADNEQKPDLGTSYGGFQYRWSYDEYKHSLEKKRKRAEGTTKLRFAVTIAMMFLLCMVILLFVLLYSQNANKEDKSSRDIGADLPSIGIYAEGISADDASDYGLERGVLVKYAISGASSLMMGDIILTVDGNSVQTAQELDDALAALNDSAVIKLWRGGEIIELDFVK